MAQDNGDRLIWFLTGAALGASVALLYAPQSGEETRRILGERIREGRDAAAETARNLAERGRQAIEYGRSTVAEMRDSIEDQLAG